TMPIKCQPTTVLTTARRILVAHNHTRILLVRRSSAEHTGWGTHDQRTHSKAALTPARTEKTVRDVSAGDVAVALMRRSAPWAPCPASSGLRVHGSAPTA